MGAVKFTQSAASSVYGRLVRTCAALTMTVVLLGSAAPSEAAATRLRSCSAKADFNLLISSARKMFCRKAHRFEFSD
jgi:hypothetical protein